MTTRHRTRRRWEQRSLSQLRRHVRRGLYQLPPRPLLRGLPLHPPCLSICKPFHRAFHRASLNGLSTLISLDHSSRLVSGSQGGTSTTATNRVGFASCVANMSPENTWSLKCTPDGPRIRNGTWTSDHPDGILKRLYDAYYASMRLRIQSTSARRP